jgi:hypothetical protein
MITKTKAIIIATIFLYGCELIQIGGARKPKPIEVNQKSAVGSVYLFKAELDSNNINGAMKVLASPAGRFYLAVEKIEMYEDLARFRNLIKGRDIAYVQTDTISADSYNLVVELDNLRKHNFKTARINQTWYITEYK